MSLGVPRQADHAAQATGQPIMTNPGAIQQSPHYIQYVPQPVVGPGGNMAQVYPQVLLLSCFQLYCGNAPNPHYL